MGIALAISLAVVFLLTVLLGKVMRSLPAKELRRRARGHKDKRAASIYRLVAFGNSAELFLWLLAALSLGGLVLIATDVAWWAGLLVVGLATWLLWMSQTSKAYSGWRLSLAALLASVIAPFVSFLQPVLSRVAKGLWRSAPKQHTGLYEKEDLLEFLKIQTRQPENRMSADELMTVRGALSLSDKSISEVMLPRRKIQAVAAGDPIGPMLMDELHQSGQLRFPVVKEITKSANPEIVGTLYLKDLLDRLEDKGRIRDIMHPGVSYINESQDLLSAIDGFLKSGLYLLVVVNNFEEVAGVVTLEDILQQIFGGKISSEFDRYHDIRSVATHNPQAEPPAHNQVSN